MEEQLGPLSPSSCKAARQLLHMTQQELTSIAGISASTLRRLEGGERRINDYARKSILQALTRNGIVFVGAGNTPELK